VSMKIYADVANMKWTRVFCYIISINW